jgi:hypothetical protein
VVAAAATLLAMAWSALTVRYNYGGNWTGLFCIGAQFSRPPELDRNVWLFPQSYGYDGQFYRIIAHDPFFQRGWQRYVDAPRKRYRRIAVPMAARLFALGRQEWIDPAYIACVWAFLFLGAHWTARFARDCGRSEWWGLAYLLVPSTAISIDRMVTDMPLVTLGLGFLYFLHRGLNRAACLPAAWLCAALASLTRETGILFPLAYAAYLAWSGLVSRVKPRREALVQAAAFSSAVVPFALWSLYVQAGLPATEPIARLPRPFVALLAAFPDPASYPLSGLALVAVRSIDYISLSSMLLCWFVVWFVREPVWKWIGAAFSLLGLFMTWQPHTTDFVEVFNYSRQYSPVLLILFLDALAASRWLILAPALPIVVRTGMQFASQIDKVVRHGLLGQ